MEDDLEETEKVSLIGGGEALRIIADSQQSRWRGA